MTLQVIRSGVIVQSVSLAQHTATMHVGSAARAAADGVASLDGSGDLPLAQVPDTLTGKDADTLDGSHAGNEANKIPILDGSGDLDNTLYAGLLKKYKIGDDILHSHNAEDQDVPNLEWTKIKEITINTLNRSPSTLRVIYSTTTNWNEVYSKIYKNGAPFGTHHTQGIGWYTYSEDLSFAQGDTIEVWADTNSDSSTVIVKDFQVRGSESDVLLSEAIGDSDLGLADPFAATNSYP